MSSAALSHSTFTPSTREKEVNNRKKIPIHGRAFPQANQKNGRWVREKTAVPRSKFQLRLGKPGYENSEATMGASTDSPRFGTGPRQVARGAIHDPRFERRFFFNNTSVAPVPPGKVRAQQKPKTRLPWGNSASQLGSACLSTGPDSEPCPLP